MENRSETFIMEEMKKHDINLDTKYWYDKHCNYHINNGKTDKIIKRDKNNDNNKDKDKDKEQCHQVYDNERSHMKYRDVLKTLIDKNEPKDNTKTYWRWPFSPNNNNKDKRGGDYYMSYQKYKNKYLSHRQ